MRIDTLRQLQGLVRARRLSLGLTQEALATQARVSRKWVSEFERGRAQSEFPIVMRVLAILDLVLDVAPTDGQDLPSTAPTEPAATGTVDLDRLLEGKFDA